MGAAVRVNCHAQIGKADLTRMSEQTTGAQAKTKAKTPDPFNSHSSPRPLRP
jgi:hypothetical protein